MCHVVNSCLGILLSKFELISVNCWLNMIFFLSKLPKSYQEPIIHDFCFPSQEAGLWEEYSMLSGW